MQIGCAKLILCLTKPEDENPVRTNESQSSNNFVEFVAKPLKYQRILKNTMRFLTKPKEYQETLDFGRPARLVELAPTIVFLKES